MSAIIRKCYSFVLTLCALLVSLLSSGGVIAQTVVLSLTLIVAARAASAQTIVRVDGEDGVVNPAGQGNGWGANAYLYLQDGIARAVALGATPPAYVQVWVRGAQTATGLTYRPDQGTGHTLNSRTETFRMRENVRIFGGFSDSMTALNQRQPEVNRTTLTGEINNAATRADNCYHVITAQSTFEPLNQVDDSARLDGFIITAGNADGSGDETSGLGGGIYVTAAAPIIQNCLFWDNDAIAGGGGHADGACNGTVGVTHPVFRSCAFIGNRADGHGAYCNRWDETTFVNCVFNGNSATGATGAIFTTGSSGCVKTINLINCTVTQNSAGTLAGGINNDGKVNLHNSIVWNNTAPSDPNISTGGVGEIDAEWNITFSDVQGGVGGLTNCPSCSPNTNVNTDPMFIDPSGGNFRLSHLTPTPVRNGAFAAIPDDEYNVDDDANTNEDTPDRDRKPRVLGSAADMGAFERYETGTCPDVDGNGVVDVDDLIGVILGWGPCPTPPALCQANVETAGTSATTVDVDDLVAVILAWGACPDNDGMIAGAIPETYEDCEDMCSAYSGDAWANCMQRCFYSLCLQGHDEFCDD
jgi:hypothetical protein